MKKACVIHQTIPENAPPDEKDVLVQADAIEDSLRELGFSITRRFQVDLNFERLYKELKKESPDVVVNLVETLDGKGKLIHMVPALLDYAGIPFTGSGHVAMDVTTDKPRAKLLMAENSLPTPELFFARDLEKLPAGKSYILKPIWEDASVGIRDENVVTTENAKQILDKLSKTGIRDWFFEEYIDGREFNVTLLETRDGWKAFSPAEIVYRGYPQGKPKILGYESKWQEDSFEYRNTVRTFGFGKDDTRLLEEIRELSLKTTGVFGLGGYARVDFRADSNNNPYILEVNANPCLSPDAGFYAACSNNGLSYTTMVSEIINAAFQKK